MRTIHRIALLAMMWVWIIPTANAQENLLKNGDFEGRMDRIRLREKT